MLTFLTISSENIATMLGYTASLLSDLNPLLLIIVGVGVGIFVFWAVVSAIKH